MKEKSRKPTQACRKGIFLSAPTHLFGCTLQRLALLLLLCSACSQSATETPHTQAAATDDAFPDKAQINYAQGFTLTYHGSYKKVNILNQFEDYTDTLHYLLVPRETAIPPHADNVQVIRIPVRQLVGTSSMHVGLADFAEAPDVLVGLANLKYVTAPRVRENIAAGNVQETGSGSVLNNELLIAMQPDLVMVTGSPDARLDLYQTLQGAGIPVMINSEWLETTPLGRAEWVKLMAALLNKEALVNQKFSRIEQEYHQLANLTKQAATKPNVITSMPFKGVWAVPDGDSYMAHFLRDAATTYAWSGVQGKGSLLLDFERVAPVALQADYWLNVGYVDSKEDIAAKDARYKDFRPYKRGTIYNNNKRVNDIGANDYWESGAVSPHLILADLIKILHPELLPGHELVYYKKIQ